MSDFPYEPPMGSWDLNPVLEAPSPHQFRPDAQAEQLAKEVEQRDEGLAFIVRQMSVHTQMLEHMGKQASSGKNLAIHLYHENRRLRKLPLRIIVSTLIGVSGFLGAAAGAIKILEYWQRVQQQIPQ